MISLWKKQKIYENLTVWTFVHDLQNGKNTDNNYSSIKIEKQSEKLPMGIKERNGNSEGATHSDKSNKDNLNSVLLIRRKP